jgi:hypothetical protein
MLLVPLPDAAQDHFHWLLIVHAAERGSIRLMRRVFPTP